MSSIDRLQQIDQLRQRQELRLLPVRELWDQAKKHLENAMALVEARERAYHEVEKDVQRNLDALTLVVGMARELDSESPEEKQPITMVSENARAARSESEEEETSVLKLAGRLRRTSRPLFSSLQRSA